MQGALDVVGSGVQRVISSDMPFTDLACKFGDVNLKFPLYLYLFCRERRQRAGIGMCWHRGHVCEPCSNPEHHATSECERSKNRATRCVHELFNVDFRRLAHLRFAGQVALDYDRRCKHRHGGRSGNVSAATGKRLWPLGGAPLRQKRFDRAQMHV